MKYRGFLFLLLIIISQHAKGASVLIKDTELDFGTVEIPFSGSQTLTVNPQDNTYSGLLKVIQAPTRGNYLIGCNPDDTIHVNITGTPLIGKLMITTLKIWYKGVTYSNFPANLGVSDGATENLYIGGTMTCLNGATEGVDTSTLEVHVELTCANTATPPPA